jgi:hypothetical protein
MKYLPSVKMTVFWDVAPCSLVELYRHFRGADLMMEAASASETSVNFYQTTRRNIPEDSHLHTPRRENLKFHHVTKYFTVICEHTQLCFNIKYIGVN